MKLPRILPLIGAAALAGCMSAPLTELPAEARSLTLVPISSPSVTLRQPGLRMDQTRLELIGTVVKVFATETTERTHLDVIFVDANGAALRTETARFYPARLTRARHAPNRQGSYVVPLAPLPSGTVRIEVRAHDAPEHHT